MSSRGSGASVDVGADPSEEEGIEDFDVVYKAPCGQSLRNHDDVIHFLVATESYDVLQVSWKKYLDPLI